MELIVKSPVPFECGTFEVVRVELDPRHVDKYLVTVDSGVVYGQCKRVGNHYETGELA